MPDIESRQIKHEQLPEREFVRGIRGQFDRAGYGEGARNHGERGGPGDARSDAVRPEPPGDEGSWRHHGQDRVVTERSADRKHHTCERNAPTAEEPRGGEEERCELDVLPMRDRGRPR